MRGKRPEKTGLQDWIYTELLGTTLRSDCALHVEGFAGLQPALPETVDAYLDDLRAMFYLGVRAGALRQQGYPRELKPLQSWCSATKEEGESNGQEDYQDA